MRENYNSRDISEDHVNQEFYEAIVSAMEEKREFIDLKKKIRAQALLLCFSEKI